uniref:Nuclear nucleic acid-binding protein C1D n=1 Tax=Fagus sylvatica TaxID=28930 RepID=A0A2N9HD88_FAGSY
MTMEGGGVVPDSVMESVNKTVSNVEEVGTHLTHFVSLSDPDVLSQMPPLQRAQTLLLLARATSTLFTLRLRCTGVHPDDHPVKSELVAPLRPSTTLNYKAATRFIEHSLPDLTSEQKRSMRSISRGEGSNIKYLERSAQKRRKYQSSEKQSVQTAAKEFLEKAARELLGDNKGGLVGPLHAEALDDDDEPVS